MNTIMYTFKKLWDLENTGLTDKRKNLECIMYMYNDGVHKNSPFYKTWYKYQ